MVNWTNLKFAIPSAVKWTIVADGLALVAKTLTYIPTSVLGVPTLPLLTVVSVTVATWEAYAIKQEANPNAPAPAPVPAPVPAPTSAPSPAPAPAPAPAPSFALSLPATAAVGSQITINVTGGTPGGTAQLFQEENNASLTGKFQLSSVGAATLQYTLDTTSPIGDILNDDGSIDIYAVDTTSGAETSVSTITKVS